MTPRPLEGPDALRQRLLAHADQCDYEANTAEAEGCPLVAKEWREAAQTSRDAASAMASPPRWQVSDNADPQSAVGGRIRELCADGSIRVAGEDGEFYIWLASTPEHGERHGKAESE